MKKLSSFFNLGANDFIKGLLIAVLGAAAQIVSDTINSGSLDFDWAAIGKTALLAGIAYLTKNLLTNSKGSFLSKEPPKE